MMIFVALLAGCSAIRMTDASLPEVNSRACEAEAAQRSDGAVQLRDATASGKYLVAVSSPGQSLEFHRVPAASKLAIRYATTNVGTISVAVNDGPVRKVNVHSSGAFTNSFLHGSSVSVIAPKKSGAGKIEIQIDSQTRATADLAATGPRLTQQVVCDITGLTPGDHQIAIINRGPGPVAVDALIVR